jgi:hypothetical protein
MTGALARRWRSDFSRAPAELAAIMLQRTAQGEYGGQKARQWTARVPRIRQLFT